ncbi:MAG: ABC transporter permease [Acetobacteraceae bacterium]|nr:ABC transporter permease [Acetobacteraceae bacterium]
MRGSLVEFGAMALALLGQATPVFWLGIMLVLFFSVRLGWLPTGGRDGLSSLILPGGTLAVFTMASVARLLRSSMIEVQSQDFVRTAWAKGLAGR